MTALQTVNLGTAPAGSDGDPVRAAFTKMNSNTAVLGTQAALTSATALNTAQALTTAHLGKRVNISLSSPGTINLPAASTCAADSVILLRNLGPSVVTLAITSGSGDSVLVSKLNVGETLLTDTDGVHTWSALMRGRTNNDNETVNGNCTVGGNETIGGTLAVTGSLSANGAAFTQSDNTAGTTAVSISSKNGSTTLNLSYGQVWTPSGWSLGVTGGAGLNLSGGTGNVAVTGPATFSVRPTFAGKTPWDSGNLTPGPVLLQTKTTQSNTMLSMVGVTGYNVYELTLTDVVPATSGGTLSMQLSGDNGSTWVSAANSYRYVLNSAGSASSSPSVISGSGTAIVLCQSLGNSSTGMFMSGTIRFYGFGRSVRAKGISWDLTCVLSDGNLYRIIGAGELQTTASVLNGILISGGFNDGVWSLYGANS